MKKIVIALLFILSINFINSQNVETGLRTPQSTIYTHLYYLQKNSYDIDKAATVFNIKDLEKAKKASIKLKRIIEAKGLKINIRRISNNPNYIDSLHYYNSSSYTLFPKKAPKIYLEKINNKWYYSEETFNNIDSIYNDVFPFGIEFIIDLAPHFFHYKILSIEVWQYIGVLILVLLSFLVFYLIKRIIFTFFKKIEKSITKYASSDINDYINSLSKPMALIIVTYLISKVLPVLDLGASVYKTIYIFIDIFISVFWIFVFIKLIRLCVEIYKQKQLSTSRDSLDNQLLPIVNNLLRGLVYSIGILHLLTLLGVDATTVIAGASIGGLAVALASQDTVKNMIGTLMIFIDKPFHIGDWIESADVVGTVEEVGFRSTRIRAADTSIYQIPNSKLSEIVINNKGLRLFRRYKTELGVRYNTPPKLIEAFVLGIRTIIDKHPDTSSDKFNVEFTGFADSSLLIMINVYFKSGNWGTEQSAKHKLHIAILELAQAIGVDFAFPTSTLYIEDFPGKIAKDMGYNTDSKTIAKNINKVIADFERKANSDSATDSSDVNDEE